MTETKLFKARPTLPLAAAAEHGIDPLSVAVLDAGGHMVAFKRQDGAGILRPQIAFGKAWGALGMGASGRKLRERLAERPQFVAALTDASEGRFVPVPGGVLALDADGYVVGAVGISGDASEKDEFCAIQGIRAAGLISEPAKPDPDWADAKL
ncbi:MAG: heme-binding protein [Magnetovibrio sp.]|nr:heme-binding protein [Magnetovibrio sp.]